MKDFCQTLEAIEPDYPIVVRLDGPNVDEGFELIDETREKLDIDMQYYRNVTLMTETASTLVEIVS